MATDAAELDLGIMDESHCNPCSPCGTKVDEQKEKKPSYPTLSFRNKHADLFKDKYGPCATDDEYEVTVRLRIKKFSDGECEYDKCIEFDVLSMIGDVVEVEGEKKEEKEQKPVRRMGNKAEAATY